MNKCKFCIQCYKNSEGYHCYFNDYSFFCGMVDTMNIDPYSVCDKFQPVFSDDEILPSNQLSLIFE